MDSKLKRLMILGSAAVIVLLLVIVVYSNGGIKSVLGIGSSGSKTAGGSDGGATENAETEAAIPRLSGQIGNDLNAFLEDSSFFDKENKDFIEGLMDITKRLSILTTSVEKDLRVQVIDNRGDLVTGETFNIRMTDEKGESSEYKDLDKDGIIYVGALSPGNYEVRLMPLGDYKVPVNSTTVRVKERVEYIVISDISRLIKTEDEIDAEAEDTAEASAEETADRTEMVSLQFGGTRQKAGIDVSAYQRDIDWEKVKAAGVEFVIIRAGYRGSVTGALVQDSYFEKNIKGATAVGLEVGVYFFTQAINEAEAVEEASAVVSMVSDYELKLPIYIDTEGAGGNGRADRLDVATRTLVCEAFCRTAKNAGYNAGIYASRNWLYNNLDTSRLEQFEIWDAEYVSVPQYKGYYTMWQHSSKGKVDGIEGNVDLDIYYY
ncbi:MAG: glycoside hydrolase family 25 protein [Lachnospiraceae bacterium]|nr:glycoside hydrolase family 25 protein [Lachnospiraceae bacterium]